MWPFNKRTTTTQIEDGGIKLSDALLQVLLDPDYMTLEKAMQIPAFSGCVNRICETVSIVPMMLYKRVGESTEKMEDDPRVLLLNHDTKDTLTGSDFKRIMTFDYLTSKGGYAYVNHRGSKWLSIHYVDSSKVSFSENVDPIFKDYKIAVNGRTYEGYRFIKFLRRSRNGYKGVSIVDENKVLLGVEYNSLLFENNLVKRGGNKRGYLQSDHKLTQDAVNTLKDAFNKMYASDDGVPVLNDGVKFQEASQSSVEMQLNENKKQNGTETCKIFCIPPAVLAGGATDKDWTAFIQYCIYPILAAFAESLNRDFLLEKEKSTYFWAPDLTELTKGDIRNRFEAYATAYKNGFMQLDEIRAKENLPATNFPYLKLGLQDVLYDPETQGVYTPNTNKWGSMNQNINEIQVEETGPSAEETPPQGAEQKQNGNGPSADTSEDVQRGGTDEDNA